ncbi:MAG: DUF190 domain-containing protein [Methanosarcinales archaeon]|nr:DUF190 domain-containing protein [Methanosarcinales archaeon]
MESEATCIRIYLTELDMYENIPLHRAILDYLKDAGIAGASVIREFEGFGQHRQVHTPVVLRLSENMPMVIEVVDTKERIDDVLAKLQEMAKGHFMTSHTVTILQGK